MKVKILFAALVLLLAYLSEAQGSCWRFGHMCWGGHGKRSGGKALMNPSYTVTTSAPPRPVHHQHRRDHVEEVEEGAEAAPLGGDLENFGERLEYDAERLALPSTEEQVAAEDYYYDDVSNKEVKAAAEVVVPIDDSISLDTVYKSYRASPKFPSASSDVASLAETTDEGSIENDQDVTQDAVIQVNSFVDAQNVEESLPRDGGGISQEHEAPSEETETLLFIRMPKRMKETKMAAALNTKDKMNSRERSRRRKWIKV